MRHPKDVSRNVALKSNTHLTEQIHSTAHDYIAPNKNNRDQKKAKTKWPRRETILADSLSIALFTGPLQAFPPNITRFLFLSS